MKSLYILISILIILLLIYEHYLPPVPKTKEKVEYAILLGCPNHNDGTMATSQIKRCNLAIEAYEKQMYQTLVISGGAVKNQYTESKEMERYIKEKKDIPILCETKARNTFENFKYVKEMIQDQPVLILSSSLHTRRSCAIAKQFFSRYYAYSYPDYKPKHILREIVSRFIYIKIEIQKKRQGH